MLQDLELIFSVFFFFFFMIVILEESLLCLANISDLSILVLVTNFSVK